MLSSEVIQLISQYSIEVYCKLRLVNRKWKDAVDEVLPMGRRNEVEPPCEWKRRRIGNDWRENFLRYCTDSCGFKLVDKSDYGGWIDAMIVIQEEVEFGGDKVEQFCRNYVPKERLVASNVLRLLGLCKRNGYVRELWDYTKDWRVLEFDKILQRDREVVLEAVKQNWKAFRFADESLKKDKGIVLEAVKQNWKALKYSDESLQRDKVFFESVKQVTWVPAHVHEVLFKKDKGVLEACMKEEYQKYYKLLNPEFKSYIKDVNTNNLVELLRLDFCGTVVRVVQSRQWNLIGKQGLLIQEDKEIFHIIEENDHVLKILKNGSLFDVHLEGNRWLRVDGSRIRYSPEMRANRKWKKPVFGMR